MVEIEVPGRGTYRLKHLVLDVNGTIAMDGQLIAGVARRLAELRRSGLGVPHINTALDMLLKPLRLVATLRQ